MVPAVLAVALLIVAVPEPSVKRQIPRFPLRREELLRLPVGYWLLLGVASLLTLGRFSDAFLILKASAVGLPVAAVPLALVGVNLVSSLASYPAGLWADRRSRRQVLFAAFPVLILADLALARATGHAGFALGIALWGLHVGLSQGLLLTLVADVAPSDLRGTAFGLFNLAAGLALLAASLLAGALWQAAGPAATFLAGAGLASLGLVALLAAARAHPELGATPRRAPAAKAI